MAVPAWCLVNGATVDMFDVVPWGEVRCRLCGNVATEAHVQSRRHQKELLFSMTRRPMQPMLMNDTGCIYVQWERDVENWGLVPQTIRQNFWEASNLMATSLPRAHELAIPTEPPPMSVTTSFWGALVFARMRNIMRDMLKKSWRGLYCFGQVAEEQWYDAMVYSDSTSDQTAQDLSPTDRGMWWPCLAIWDGRRFRTWCQAFALNGTRTTWDTSPSRIHIYRRRNQPTPWAESTATAPSSGAASSSPPPPPPPPPTASAPTDRGMWWAPPPPSPPPPTASAPPPPPPPKASAPQAAPSSGAAEQSPEPDYVWTTTVVIEDLSDTDLSDTEMEAL